MYQIYPTLLGSFAYYLKSEMSFEEMIARINRQGKVHPSAGLGVKMEDFVNKAITLYQKNGMVWVPDSLKKELGCTDQVFDILFNRLKGAIQQIYVEGVLETRYGQVKLYGYMDYLIPGNQKSAPEIVDLKTTHGQYNFPKYLSGLQRVVYPYCLHKMGADVPNFTYLITDFSQVYEEPYVFDYKRDVPALRQSCERFLEFVSQHRSLITDTKLFSSFTIAA